MHCPTTLQHADTFTNNLPIARFVPNLDIMHSIRFISSSPLVSDTAKAGEGRIFAVLMFEIGGDWVLFQLGEIGFYFNLSLAASN